MRTIAVWIALAVPVLTPAAGFGAEEWGDLSATFVFGGDAPGAKPLTVTTDKEFCGRFRVVDESLTVDADSRGLANVVAYLYLGRSDQPPKAHPSYEDTASDKVKLDNNCCRFDPHVLLLRTTQTLVVANSDKVAHNCMVAAFSNPPFNQTIPEAGEYEQRFSLAEPRPCAVSCSIHPWMKGWLVVKDNPYMAVSDAQGQLVIKNLPVGTWTFQFWQEKVGYIDRVVQNGQAKSWPRGRLELTIKPGKNELGKIQLDPAAFVE